MQNSVSRPFEKAAGIVLTMCCGAALWEFLPALFWPVMTAIFVAGLAGEYAKAKYEVGIDG